MPHFSNRSRERLLSCDSRLITLCSDVIRHFDFSVTDGHRTEEEQDALYAVGRTMPGRIVTWARGGESIHNTSPSRAIDLAPWPIDWQDEQRFIELGGAMMYAAWLRKIPLEWGGHWSKKKRDLPHFQVPPR